MGGTEKGAESMAERIEMKREEEHAALQMQKEALVRQAVHARRHAYAPYSGFAVGAALLCADGAVYTGCNIECVSYGGTNCAERTALFKAVSEGYRQFSMLAVAGGKKDRTEKELELCPPCGICRQVLAEFCGENFLILLAEGGGWKEYTLGELLPVGFHAELK